MIRRYPSAGSVLSASTRIGADAEPARPDPGPAGPVSFRPEPVSARPETARPETARPETARAGSGQGRAARTLPDRVRCLLRRRPGRDRGVPVHCEAAGPRPEPGRIGQRGEPVWHGVRYSLSATGCPPAAAVARPGGHLASANGHDAT